MSNSSGATEVCCITAPLLNEPLTQRAAAEMAKKLSALADRVRLRLFSASASLAGGEAGVCDMSGGIDVSQPTGLHHLEVLRDVGLLASQRRASCVYYGVVPEALGGLPALLAPKPATLVSATA